MIERNANSLIFFLLILVCVPYAFSQESVNASGADAIGSGGSVSYSIGQVMFTTTSSNSGIVIQGIQQAFEIYTNGIIQTELNISVAISPNPTAENLTLQISDYNNEKLSFLFHDLQNKLLESGQIASPKTQIKTSHLSSGIYFLDIYNHENKKVQSFKINP